MAEPTNDANSNVQKLRELAKEADHGQAVRDFYDKWAVTYDQDLDSRNKYTTPVACVETLSKVVPDKSALIVDCAAGTGKVGEELAKQGYKRIHAVDFSQKSLDISASKGVYERLICAGFGKDRIEELEDGGYDALICVGAVSVGHITQAAFPEWTRNVKKGGYMVFTVGKAMFETDVEKCSSTLSSIRDGIDDMVRRGAWEVKGQIDAPYFCEHKADIFVVRRL